MLSKHIKNNTILLGDRRRCLLVAIDGALFAQRQAGELIGWLLGNVGQTTWLQISVIAP